MSWVTLVKTSAGTICFAEESVPLYGPSHLTSIPSFPWLPRSGERGYHMAYWRSCLINLAKQPIPSRCFLSIYVYNTVCWSFLTSWVGTEDTLQCTPRMLLSYYLHHWLWMLESVFSCWCMAVFMGSCRNTMHNEMQCWQKGRELLNLLLLHFLCMMV